MGIEHKRTYKVGFEVLTSVVMKSSDFWDITPLLTFNGLHGVITQKI
jgi:hypothetical protein